MPMTFDLDDIEISLREPALHDLLGQIPVPIDVSTGAVDRLHVSTVSDFFGRLFLSRATAAAPWCIEVSGAWRKTTSAP
jgi:hypothetical protein